VNTYDSLRAPKRRIRVTGVLLAILLFLEVCSMAVLFGRISFFTPRQTRNIFPLTESLGRTTVRMGKRTASGELLFPSDPAPISHSAARSVDGLPIMLGPRQSAVLLSAQPSLGAQEEGDLFWQGSTEIHLFRYTYENGEGNITVEGDGADKLLAPGTENRYSFTLKNTDDVSMDYAMHINARIDGTEYAIPLLARVIDHDGSYLLGDEESFADMIRLNEVEKSGTLAKDCFWNFAIEWMWPFEGDDAYDTLLGNLSAEAYAEGKAKVTFTVEIVTVATRSENPEDPGDNPNTGDRAGSMPWIILIILIVLIAVAWIDRRDARRRS